MARNPDAPAACYPRRGPKRYTHVNLLGIVNLITLSQLVNNCEFLFEPSSGDLTIKETAQSEDQRHHGSGQEAGRCARRVRFRFDDDDLRGG